MKTDLHILDANDGPQGGGGAALSRALSQRGVTHTLWVNDALSSGWPDADNSTAEVRWMPEDREQTDVPGLWSDDATVLPGSLSALTWFSPRIGEKPTQSLEAPRHLNSLLLANDESLKTAPFSMLETANLKQLQSNYLASHLLNPEGQLISCTDGGEAWLQLSRAQRSGKFPLAAVGAHGAPVFQVALVTRGKRCLSHIALRVDAAYESWRVALGRVVRNKNWERFADDVARFKGRTGFYTVWATILNDDDRPRFMTSRPTPPDWLPVAGSDGGCLVEALLGQDPTSSGPDAQTTYAAIPFDSPITAHELIKRNPSHE